ncbi:MAG TPA: malto-oligosyltrehalose trehalohydrolase [Puia sp.]|nr:malto-oligosyltrehalose trehalohydrolase [Puia sp.]
MITSLQKPGAWYIAPGAGNVRFAVWAPLRKKVDLVLATPEKSLHPMEKDAAGYWWATLSVVPGTRYGFRLDDAPSTLPDPASLSQPEGVHALSEVVDVHAFPWNDGGWKGLPLSNRIIYELHTGTFSPTHDFEGICQKLDYLHELGINTIELMPLAQFPGSRGWGYDGVYPYAIQHSYGGLAGFQRLVNAAHAIGMSVIVDVVYNHLGPEGNYLHEYGVYFTDRYNTPWGRALNYDDAWCDGVRTFFLQNARFWLEDVHVDALRLDAVHAIFDNSAIPFLQQLKEVATEIGARTGCKKELIVEMDLNAPRYINPIAKGGYGMDGQWADEFHHALRALLTGDTSNYYEDFGDITHLERAFRNTYVYNNVYSPHRHRTFGGSADNNPYDQFVVFAQNHDHIGNRVWGNRLTDVLGFEQLKLAAATMLLSPYVPLLFMGEEYGEKHPFQYFVDFGDPALIKAVHEGRAREFKHTTELPDPQSEDTFNRSVLSWRVTEEPGATLLRYYRHLIRFRQTRPALQGRTRDTMVVHQPSGLTLPIERKILTDQLFIWFHFGDQPVSLQNITWKYLGKVFDSADTQWRGPGAEAAAEVRPGEFLRIAPYSVVVYEKNN